MHDTDTKKLYTRGIKEVYYSTFICMIFRNDVIYHARPRYAITVSYSLHYMTRVPGNYTREIKAYILLPSL